MYTSVDSIYIVNFARPKTKTQNLYAVHSVALKNDPHPGIVAKQPCVHTMLKIKF